MNWKKLLIQKINIYIVTLILCFIATPLICGDTNFVLKNLNVSKNIIALTFDDGPHKTYTPKLLKILKEKKVEATFFVVGQQSNWQETILNDIKNAGHEIGNHSFDHKNYDLLSMDEVKKDIALSQRIFYKRLGYFPKYFRAPYGEVTEEQQQFLKKYFYRYVSWDIDAEDWKYKQTSENITETVLTMVEPGSIVLLHDNNKQTIEALPEIIDELRAEGFEFKTISELIKNI